MASEYTAVIERVADGYLVGSVPSLKGCHTRARSMDELLEQIKEAIEVRLEAPASYCPSSGRVSSMLTAARAASSWFWA
jgi:predicted RNase H-like HicB family nuclease